MRTLETVPTMRNLVAVLLLLFAVSCGSATDRGAAPSSDVAVWMIDDDACMAFPTCPTCGTVVDRATSSCDVCGASVRIEPETIACPECSESKACVHCGVGHSCVACMGAHDCAICDGGGTWHGETCPECDGAKACVECAILPAAHTCEYCDATRVCSNCDGTGTITLR